MKIVECISNYGDEIILKEGGLVEPSDIHEQCIWCEKEWEDESFDVTGFGYWGYKCEHCGGTIVMLNVTRIEYITPPEPTREDVPKQQTL